MVATADTSESHLSRSALVQLVEPLVIRGAIRGFESGPQYRGVYPHRSGFRPQFKWFGKQKKLATRRTALEAAGALAEWYRDRLGPNWGAIFEYTGKVYPKHHAPWRVFPLKGGRGFAGAVWVEGRRQEVVRLVQRQVEVEDRKTKAKRVETVWEPTNRRAIFPSEGRAIEYLFAYVVRRYGQYGLYLLWRRPA